MVRGTVLTRRIAWTRPVPTDVIVRVEGTGDAAAARKLIGKKVRWTQPGQDGNALAGRVIGLVGADGRVLVRFDRPFPPHGVPSTVDIG